MPGDALEEVEEAVNLDRTIFSRKCTDDNATGGIMARLYRRATLGNFEPCEGWPGRAKWARVERSFATVEVSNHMSCVTKPSTAQENEYQANTGREI